MITMITRPASDEYAPYYGRYISQVPDGDILATLHGQTSEVLALLRELPESRGDFSYAPGKWTVKEVIGHVTDTERVFAYRTLRFARADNTSLPGFEQDGYVSAAGFGNQTLADLVSAFAAVRMSTLFLLRGLDAGAWDRRGEASGHAITVRALAYVIAGHELHHMRIVRSHYL